MGSEVQAMVTVILWTVGGMLATLLLLALLDH